MSSPDRRASDALKAVDSLLAASRGEHPVGGRPLANLAAAMAIEYSGADRGALLIAREKGLVPVLALDRTLEKTPAAAGLSEVPAVLEAASGRRLVAAGRQVAAPISIRGQLRGVLYLERDSDPLEAGSAELAAAVADRISTLLFSADLVEEVSRRTGEMETLESLSAALAAGRLSAANLDRALEAVIAYTSSPDVLLGLIDRRGGVRTLRVAGREPESLRALGDRIVEGLAQGDARPHPELLGEPCLFEVLWADLIPAERPERGRRPAGFLAARRPAGAPYRKEDRTFFAALAHLLSGALARIDYFHRASEDPLTETGSRLALQIRLAEAEAATLKAGKPFSVVLVDVDRFKEINDRHGHLVGDAVLQEVAALLRSRLRAQDSVARYGGDEFVLILPLTESEEAAHLAGELRKLAGERKFSDHQLSISLSMGVATFSVEAEDLREILRRADEALYQSKSAGRNRVTISPKVELDR